MDSSVSAELAAACKKIAPDIATIKRLLLPLTEEEEHSSSVIAHCLVTILANRKTFHTRKQFIAAVEAIEFLIELDPDCLSEIIKLNHTPKKSIKQVKSMKQMVLPTSESDHSKVQQSRHHAKPSSSKRVNTSQGPSVLIRKRYDSNVSALESQVGGRRLHRVESSHQSLASYSAPVQGTLERARKRHDRYASVTSFDADFDPKLTRAVKQKHKKQTYSQVRTLKSFCFTPVYTLFESFSEPKRQSTVRFEGDVKPEDTSDLQHALLHKFCVDYGKYTDVNMMLSVKINSQQQPNEMKTNVPSRSQRDRNEVQRDLCSYQPVWHRLLNHGNLQLLKLVLDNVEIGARKTMFEVRTVLVPVPMPDETSAKNISFGISERGLSAAPTLHDSVHGQILMQTKQEKFIVSSRTALHELSSWTSSKIKSLNLTQQQVADFAEILIQKGADIDAISMRKEERISVIKSTMRKYTSNKKFKVKPLPSETVSFYLWQTPLSLAIRSRNMLLVKLLAKHGARQDYGDLFYPRTGGIPFNPETVECEEDEEELGFKVAADLETVPTVYSLTDVYYKMKELDGNFLDWKFVIDNDKLFDQCFEAKKNKKH